MAILNREEYIEQIYFFRNMRERIAAGMATQDVLERIDQEILSTTKLPMAIQFLATEVKDSGLLSAGFGRLPHYFTPFQAFIVRSSENEHLKFSIDMGLNILEKLAIFMSGEHTPCGLFVFQFETLARNRLGYEEGVHAMAQDAMYSEDWRQFIRFVEKQIGLVEFAELVYLRSDFYVKTQQRSNAEYVPPVAPLFGEKEGKIARANIGRDPFFLFAALQRQLGYPEVPRTKPKDEQKEVLTNLQLKLRDMDTRIKLLEAEVRGNIDLEKFGKPDILAQFPPKFPEDDED